MFLKCAVQMHVGVQKSCLKLWQAVGVRCCSTKTVHMCIAFVGSHSLLLALLCEWQKLLLVIFVH